MTIKTAVWGSRFLNDEQGQDLIEYTLLLAFIALGSAFLMGAVGSATNGVWSQISAQLAAANAAS